MDFYYSSELNICAERDWVADYLFIGNMVKSREEAEKGLEACEDFFGWHNCGVSNTIAEFFQY